MGAEEKVLRRGGGFRGGSEGRGRGGGGGEDMGWSTDVKRING